MTFKYKCRLCKEVHGGSTGGRGTVLGCLESLVSGNRAQVICGTAPKLIDMHPCRDGNFGISDLLGAERNKP